MIGGHRAQEVVGRIVVDERVAVVGEEIARIVETAQRQQRIKQIGAAEEEVSGMETAHAAARHNECLIGAAAYFGDEFVGDVVKPLFV